MKSAYYFIDPAFFSTVDLKEYKREKIFDEFVKFYNLLKEIEKRILPDGSREQLFKFPIKELILDTCMTKYSPSKALPEENKFFWKTFNRIRDSYFSYCSKKVPKLKSDLYYNPTVPDEIIMLFNSFLEGCFSEQDNTCNCRPTAESFPIYINSDTKLKNNKKLVSFNCPNDLMIYFPPLLGYPIEKDSIERKKKKMRLLLEINYYKRQKKLLSQEFEITDEFWTSDYLFDGDDELKKDIIRVMTDLIEDPSTTKNERKILKGIGKTIEGVKKRLEQCYINQHRILKGKKIYPRLHFIVQNKIYFIKVIEGHP